MYQFKARLVMFKKMRCVENFVTVMELTVSEGDRDE